MIQKIRNIVMLIELPTVFGLMAMLVSSFVLKDTLQGQDESPQIQAIADESVTFDEVEEPRIPTIESLTTEMERREGFQTFYWDENEGKIWLEISDLDQEFLYTYGLATGLGSNPVGLDRGQQGDNLVVRFHRVGPRVFLQQRNLRYQANTDNPAERRAVEDSFATSIIWSAKISAQTGSRLLVDGTSLLVRDAHQVSQTLSRSDQGSFSLDKDRSYVYLPGCKAFVDNSEFEITLTFSGNSPGRRVRETTPSPNAITLRQHHSFVRLPDNEYRPRRFDPRVGGFSLSFADYSVPLNEPIDRHWVVRHRLQKQDPTAIQSPPVEPIIYYVDSGVPQPVLDALLEGARWWNEAFESAGYLDAFEVRVLPDDADPMDVRFNMIQWVHRSTRGWSYGQSVIDPRTGEIIKGHVLLGSLRVRQDRLIFEGLEGIDNETHASHRQSYFCQACQSMHYELSESLAPFQDQLSPVDVSLARIRQLSAHEVGHTLGFAHNFAASTYGDRASVMDYPAPRVAITETGEFDLSDAYGVGIGIWDKFTVRYAYTDFPEGVNEDEALEEMIDQAIRDGMVYLSDSDARPTGAADPRANLWDNGSDPIAELEHLMRVREIGLARFDQHRLSDGRPLSELEQVLVPIYLLHRYQVDAVAKMIGGVQYRYAVKGELQSGESSDEADFPFMEPIDANRQREALAALLRTIDPDVLVLRDELADLIPPKPYSTINDIERFPGRTSMIFDRLAPAEAAIRTTILPLFQTQRLNRVAQQRPEYILDEHFQAIIDFAWNQEPSSRDALAIRYLIQEQVLRSLIAAAESTSARPEVVATSRMHLRHLQSRIDLIVTGSDASTDTAYQLWVADRIEDYFTRNRDSLPSANPLDLPPGSPIGENR